jgi:hypothetical protein
MAVSREPVDQTRCAHEVGRAYCNREDKSLESGVIDPWDGYITELVLVQ